MAKKKDGIASVLAFEKKLVFSDGYMYGTNWETREMKETPIHLVEKSVRGTISNRLPASVTGDPAKLRQKVENANLQTVDSASLSLEQDTLKLWFTLKILPNPHIPSACNDETHFSRIKAMGEKYIEENGFKELAKRYAVNIANARVLWRNRVGAEELETVVFIKELDKKLIFNSSDISMKNFDIENVGIEELAELIAGTLCGSRSVLLLEVTSFAKIGNGQEVYPSEELVLGNNSGKGKIKGEKSKILYSVNGTAAMHSQKLGNAIRTIDTWYPGYDEISGPIAIEVYGSVTNLGRAYRGAKKDKKDFYTLFDKWSSKEALDSKDDENYVMSLLVRGGVFGETEKKEENKE